MITKENIVCFLTPEDLGHVGEQSYYLNAITLLNGDRITMGSKVGIGADCWLNGYGGIDIGDGTMLGPRTMIHSANHSVAKDARIEIQGWGIRPVLIGSDCWIGMGVTICPGARIGDGSVIGAGSVVTGDLGGMAIYAGNPAKFIKERT